MSSPVAHAPLGRCLAVWLCVTGSSTTLTLATAGELGAARRAYAQGTLATQPFDVLLVWLAALVAVGCLLWLWLVTTVVAVGAARGRAGSHPIGHTVGCPVAVRRLLLTACGVALAGGLAAPAHAVPTHLHGEEGGGSALEGLPLPERPAGPRDTAKQLTPPPAPRPDAPAAGVRPEHSSARPGDVVVVRAGDTLWDLAAAGLPDDATPAAVDERWRAIYAVNADRVGPDPDLILPTTTLRLPRRTR